MIYQLKPVYFHKIWGGEKLRKTYHYDCPENCGEAWGISGHPHGSSVILNGKHKGKTLADLYQSNKELFGNHPSKEFPILVKLIDAAKDLSIQIHPDDTYAKKHHDSLGKTECWYILEAEKNTDIIIGHNKQTIEELKKAVDQNNYQELVNKYKIKKDELFMIPAGTIHAICEGTLLLEIQQSSDITYRFYDYDRLENGEKRELHVQQALDVIKVPDQQLNHQGTSAYFSIEIVEPKISTYVANQYGDYMFIIEGEGLFDDVTVKKGDFLFIPSKNTYQISGKLQIAKMQIK